MVVGDDLGVYQVDVDIILLTLHLLLILLGVLQCSILLLGAVMECTDLFLIASVAVAVLPFVLVRMVQLLNRGVAFLAEEAVGAEFPRKFLAIYLLHTLAVLCSVLEYLWRPPEVTHVVREDAALRIMRVLHGWAPA